MSTDTNRDAEDELRDVGQEGDEPAGPADEPLLAIDGVSVEFETGNFIEQMLSDTAVQAVSDVSLEIEEEDVVALVGESGSGKTTLGKTAIGLQRPSAGTVRFRGQEIWEAKESPEDADIDFAKIRRSLQIIHQDPESALNSSRQVRAILSDPLKKYRQELDAEERLETIHRFLEYVDMTPAGDYADRFPHQLSGGEKQRVALGRAMLMNPELILADEAVSALDVSLRVDMMDLMLELQDLFGTSYLFISHDLANARYLAKRAGGKLAIMYLGEIVEIGAPDDVIENPTHPYTEVLKWSMPPIDYEEAREVVDERPPVRRIDVPDPADPPSGCRFHTRCPEATEVCTRQHPDRYGTDDGTEAACFRALEDHEYWDSPALEDEEEIGFLSED